MANADNFSGILENTRLHVEDAGGPGRPIVLIHGWPLSGAAWKYQIQAFTDAGLRVITYDRRGFGQSERSNANYDYDTLADDLSNVITGLRLEHVSIVGFSMGGGEVARYITRHSEDRLHSVVFASAVTPFMAKTETNPDGPLTHDQAQQMMKALVDDRSAFFDGFTTDFFSANGQLKVTEQERQEAIALCRQSDQNAAIECMKSFGTTDFREDLMKVSVPTLVIHGDSDATVPFEGSGKLTYEAIPQSELVVLKDAPHGCNVSHKNEFNEALISFLSR
jgi:non-heme chloroperoxidase